MAPHVLVVAALALAAGCSVSPLAVDVRADGERVEGVPEVVEAACDLWGLDCYPATGDEPHVRIDLRAEHPPNVTGEATGVWGCSRSLWAWDGPGVEDTIAHELGHVFGVQHSGSTRNLMFPSQRRRTDVAIDPDQLEQVDRDVAWFQACPIVE